MVVVPVPASNCMKRCDLMRSDPSMGRMKTSKAVRRMLTSRKRVTSAVSDLTIFVVMPFCAVFTLVPEVRVRLFEAAISMFLADSLMVPLGALMVMPWKALMFTVPKEDVIEILRLSVDMLMLTNPK